LHVSSVCLCAGRVLSDQRKFKRVRGVSSVAALSPGRHCLESFVIHCTTMPCVTHTKGLPRERPESVFQLGHTRELSQEQLTGGASARLFPLRFHVESMLLTYIRQVPNRRSGSQRAGDRAYGLCTHFSCSLNFQFFHAFFLACVPPARPPAVLLALDILFYMLVIMCSRCLCSFYPLLPLILLCL
jgi:hypothetical protein